MLPSRHAALSVTFSIFKSRWATPRACRCETPVTQRTCQHATQMQMGMAHDNTFCATGALRNHSKRVLLVQCKAHVNARHISMQDTCQCKAHVNARHMSMQGCEMYNSWNFDQMCELCPSLRLVVFQFLDLTVAVYVDASHCRCVC